MSEIRVAQTDKHQHANGSIESHWTISLAGRDYPIVVWGMPTDGGLTWSYMTHYLKEEGAAHGFASEPAALDHIIDRLEARHRPLAHRLLGRRQPPRRHVEHLARDHDPHPHGAQLRGASEAD